MSSVILLWNCEKVHMLDNMADFSSNKVTLNLLQDWIMSFIVLQHNKIGNILFLIHGQTAQSNYLFWVLENFC